MYLQGRQCKATFQFDPISERQADRHAPKTVMIARRAAHHCAPLQLAAEAAVVPARSGAFDFAVGRNLADRFERGPRCLGPLLSLRQHPLRRSLTANCPIKVPRRTASRLRQAPPAASSYWSSSASAPDTRKMERLLRPVHPPPAELDAVLVPAR
jgi:hypothetical protein